ncbi:MAG: DHA2 family efflux MFS transporter permease subunit [Ignavibacteriales bacterium]|nr:DHA2 family efflux MFS transporter permease subunit [Ignavibacteriales bacterium]
MFNSKRKSIRGAAINQISSLHHEHTSYKWWVLANVMIGTFMAVLDATIVDVSLAKIMATFGIGVDTVKWVATSYLLVFAIMLPTSGWIADHFGYKKTYASALGLFTIGSLLCSLAWNESALIVFRVIQGAGAGLMMPVGMAIVMREFPPERRGVAIGFWTIAAAASVSLGPTLGGYLIDNFAWHAIFDVNVPVGIVGVFATLVIQREYKTSATRSFDFIGFISMAVFLSALLIALSDGNSEWNTGGWTSPFIVTCFAISLIAFVVFMITELNVRHPLIDLSLLKNFNFAMANIILFIFGMGMFGSTFLLPLYLQNGLGYTAFQAGSLFLPIGFLQAVMSPIAGNFADRINPKIPALIGIVLLAASLFLNHFLSLFSETSSIMISLYLRGLAMGWVFTPLSTIALSGIPRERMAQASGLFNVLRQVGGSFGVALMGTLLTDRTIFHITSYGQAVNQYAPATKNIVSELTRYAQHAVGGTNAVSAMRANALVAYHLSQQAFVSAVDDDFFIAALITILCVVPILFLRYKKKKGPAQKIVTMD